MDSIASWYCPGPGCDNYTQKLLSPVRNFSKAKFKVGPSVQGKACNYAIAQRLVLSLKLRVLHDMRGYGAPGATTWDLGVILRQMSY